LFWAIILSEVTASRAMKIDLFIRMIYKLVIDEGKVIYNKRSE